MKIKCDSDDDLSLNKQLKLATMTVKLIIKITRM